ncbi:MAG: sigma-54-dependent Fis family transcriptional regulator [Verrucomicrobia bacterium]|nr:sigma-54-dependent Fis family transcriptional regulator [Verrucomicrobiota bacterium]
MPQANHPTTSNDSKWRAILRICQKMNSERNLDALLDLLAQEACNLLDCDRASLFLLDASRNELWSKVAMGVSGILRIDTRQGIVGAVATSGQTVNVPDAYADARFDTSVDTFTGYRTRNLLAIPLRRLDGEVVGTFEVLNKHGGSPFTAEDEESLQCLAAQAAIALQNAQIFDEINRYRSDLERENARLWRETAQTSWSTRIAGTSVRIQHVLQQIHRIKDSSVNVLIGGESGTGKELAARAIHESSLRARKHMVALNCAALPETLIESELFGIERGVATGVERRVGQFEAANGGTLFLDEIGDLSLTAQAKILRVLQDQRIERVGGRGASAVDVRVVSATNKDLEAEIQAGRFREDLYYRLKVVFLRMPSLREIPEDIPILANRFLSDICREQGRPRMEFAPQLMEQLQTMAWPGNSRQLQNEIRRLVACSSGPVLRHEDWSEGQPIPRPLTGPSSRPTTTLPPESRLGAAVEALERRLISEALQQCGHNQLKAAKLLGISRQGLLNKLKRFGLSKRANPEERPELGP